MKHLLEKFLADTSGATMVEYGMIATLIVGAIVAAMTPVANTLAGSWATMNTTMAG